MNKRILKIVLALVLVCCAIISFSACAATSVPDAEDAEGKIDGTDIEWEYDADDKLLSVTGTGAIPDFENAESVSWYGVRHSAEKIEISDGITAIGDYAFYYCPKLTDVEIPESVTSVGKLAFAFCSSLKEITLPSGLTSVGEGCFEACIALEGITLPNTVTTLGARAFAHCTALEDVIILGNLTSIESWTFKSCKALDALLLTEAAKDITAAEDAFEGAGIEGIEGASFTSSATGEVTLTVKYVYEADGSEAMPTYTETHAVGDSYSVNSYEIEGYKPSEAVVSGVISGDETVVVKYTSTGETTETEAEVTETEETEVAPEEPKSNVGTVIAIVIFAVVIVAIIVLVIIMMRSDKKQNNASKNGKNKNSK